MSNAQDSIKRIIDAQTVREIMQAGFPQKVDNIPDPGRFDAFSQSPLGPEARTTLARVFDEKGNTVPIIDKNFKEQTREADAAFSDVRAIITAAEVQALGDRISGSRIDARGIAKDNVPTPMVHPDLIDTGSPYGAIRGRNYVASTQNATLIVPDEATLEIVKEFPFSQILDLKIDDPNDAAEIRQHIYDYNMANFDFDGERFRPPELDEKTVSALHEMHDRLQACLEPQEDGAVIVMSNLTFHARNLPFPSGRVFFQGLGYHPDDDVPNNTLDL